MPKITAAQYELAYKLAEDISLGHLTQSEAVSLLKSKTGMNTSSAVTYLTAYRSMKEGVTFGQTINEAAYKFVFTDLASNQSMTGLSNAIRATELHLAKNRNPQNNIKAIINEFSLIARGSTKTPYPDEVTGEPVEFIEGAVKQVTINAYERDPKARSACIDKYGAICQVCKFNFEAIYGQIGKGFIHVHHKTDIATIGESYQIDPINDLIPVCPNCHAILHTETPAMSIEKLKLIIQNS